ncbi:hypothetical protein HYH03_017514 [Edaphochlamys debaryana]|uniref:Mannose-P-dolichol utilization defect 1 protein n=1 Tax=Edaphochlamys debaryana TaxID=47281 RepID=A0A835XJX4_9CHLO|nr:hypothetical protein HYH03_017514 [Edaphochlamys debaryana]|eukprot:KAG2483636.1 hypothetical protein HYH03_017514 [Edaphochlamys debaryana]
MTDSSLTCSAFAPAAVAAPRCPRRPEGPNRSPLAAPPPSARRAVSTAAAAAAGAAAAAATAAPCCTPATAAAAGTAAAAAASNSWMDMFAVLLGYGCLIGSCFRSVPQIAIILKTGSAEGLSLTSNLMELICFTISVAYNVQQGYAFNTYGEVMACWIQDVIIVGLIFKHMKLGWAPVVASAAVFGVSCAWLFSPAWCPMEVLSWLQMSTIVVMAIGARLPQIWLNIKRGNAGVLSVATCVLNVAGCVVRTFTTIVLTGDVIILGGCITQLILNGVLLYQAVVTPGNVGGSGSETTSTAAAAVAAADPAAGGVGESRAKGPAAEQLRGGSGDKGEGEGGLGVAPAVPAPA